MPAQDTSIIKEKIISIIRMRGPSLPVHIAKGIEMSILFTSAFLSELLSEKRIEISNMKVGSSPIYLLPEQNSQLEKFSHHLKSKEKEAFKLLKENNFLKDKEQEPAIRVALREIKDFAIPFKKDEEIYWRYFTIPEEKFQKEKKEESKGQTQKETNIELKENIQKDEKEKRESKIEKPIPQISTSNKSDEQSEEQKISLWEEGKESNSQKEKILNIFDNKEKITQTKKPKKKNPPKNKKQNQKLFNKVKDFLSEKNIQITDFQSLSKDELILKIEENNQEKLLIAFNKKRITELDLIKLYKKIGEKNIPYVILSKGDISNKFMNLIEIIKKIDRIENIEK